MVHRKELEHILSILLERKADLNNELESLPEGSLYCLKNDDRWFYYQLLPKTGNRKKEKRIGISRDIDRIFALTRKLYIDKTLVLIEKDIKVLEMAIKHYVNLDEESVMARFLVKHPELRDGIYHGRQSDEAWAEDYEKQTDFYKNKLRHVSAKGILMRSKNEVYIASRLDHYSIPYRYECPVAHPDVYRIPDFTIRRPRDDKIIYWEHMGLTGDEDYLNDNARKQIEFQHAGIVPWDNLILTYDSPDGSIDAKIIEAMILGWLL